MSITTENTPKEIDGDFLFDGLDPVAVEFDAEKDDDESEGPSGAGAVDFKTLIVAPVDFTVGTLASMIGKQIDLNPDFQRRGVWNRTAKSKLIESLILGVPVPQILLAAMTSNKSRYLVIDGKQRLIAINEFVVEQSFRLSGLSILKELNGKRWSDLASLQGIQDAITNEPIRTTVLRGWDKDAVLYEIFGRLNSGSVPLSPMELRMSLHPGDFLKHIIDYTKEAGPIQKAIGLPYPDPRMKDVELIIRFLAFNDQSRVYTGNLKEFLDNFCEQSNKGYTAIKSQLAADLVKLEESTTVGKEIFGADFGKKFSKSPTGEFRYERLFNRAVFEIVVGSLFKDDFRAFAMSKHSELKMAFEELSANDVEFVQSLSTSTKNVLPTRKRFTAWYEQCFKLSGIAMPIPNIAGEVLA